MEKYVIEVTNLSTLTKLFYPCPTLGTTIFHSMDEILDKISELIKKTGCVSYKFNASFSVKNLNDVKNNIDVISI